MQGYTQYPLLKKYNRLKSKPLKMPQRETVMFSSARLKFIAFASLAFLSQMAAHPSYANTYATATNQTCMVYNQYPQVNETLEYTGECVEGYAQGMGSMNWLIDGKAYQTASGNLVRGKFEGICEMNMLDNPLAYKGMCENNVPHGQGKMTYKDGSNFEGQFIHGKAKLP